MRHLILAALVFALATPAFGDLYRQRVDPSYANRHGTARTLSRQHIIGGRALNSDYSRRPYYGYGSRRYGSHGYRQHRGGDTTVIIIERDVPRYGRRWR